MIVQKHLNSLGPDLNLLEGLKEGHEEVDLSNTLKVHHKIRQKYMNLFEYDVILINVLIKMRGDNYIVNDRRILPG